jgi:hypothetical protein
LNRAGFIVPIMRLLIDQGEFQLETGCLRSGGGSAASASRVRPCAGPDRALEVEGRLKIRVGSGIYVIEQQQAAAISNSASIEGPFEILRARAFVESAIAEEAARHATAEDVARLDGVLAEVADQSFVGDGFLMRDRRFHTCIAEILGNGVLVRCVGELFDLRINPYFERLERHTLAATAWRTAHEEHVTIRDDRPARSGAHTKPCASTSNDRMSASRGFRRAALGSGDHLFDSMGDVKATA